MVNPWEKIVAEKKKGTGLMDFKINLDEVHKARLKIPSIKGNKPYLIKSESSWSNIP